MRNEIENILEKYGILKLFIIGSGAKHAKSVIHYNIKKDKKEIIKKQFAIQYEETSRNIALWDIRERISYSASLNLYAKNIEWQDIRNTTVFDSSLFNRGSGISSKVILFPITEFDLFIENNQYIDFNIDIDHTKINKEKYESIDVIKNEKEGKKVYYYGTKYERDKNMRDRAISIHGYSCHICGFNYKEFYGEVGYKYIEIHHLKPLNQGERETNPETDLIPICANCHGMIHRKKTKILSPEELKNILNNKNRNF